MTAIRDPAVPTVQGETRDNGAQKFDRVTSGRRLVVLLGFSALVLTIANLAASAYLLSAIGELRAVDARLQDLNGLEKRLKSSLDVVNTGIQTRLDTLDRTVHDRVAEVDDGIGQIQHRLDQPRADPALPELETTADAVQPAADVAAAESLPEPAEDTAETADAAVSSIKPRRTAKPPASKVGSAYQRTETADGKVYYRRLQ